MNRLTEISKELHAISTAGVLYSKNEFDKERFHMGETLAAELLTIAVEDMPIDKAAELFGANDGYQTPKCDTRAAVFNEKGEILLVHDYDGKWALPGGWCDYDQTIYSNTVKEVYEEAGLKVNPKRFVCAHNHRGRNNPKSFFSVIRFFTICEVVSGEFTANSETSETKYFNVNSLPEDLNTHKSTPEQIKLCYEAYLAEEWIPEID